MVFPAAASSRENIPKNVGINRVEAAEGLVEEKQLGIVNETSDQLYFLLVALAQGFCPGIAVFRHAKPLQPAVGRTHCIRALHSAQRPKVGQLLYHRDFGVQSPLFRHVPHPDPVAPDGLSIP